MRNRIIPSRSAPRGFAPLPPPPGPARREVRTPVSERGWMELAEQRHDIALLDMSRNGFGAKADISVPIGAEVTVWLPHYGTIRAQVRWALCGFFGGRFLDRAPTALDPAMTTNEGKELCDGHSA
jgi:hypothetical protein